MVKIESLVIVKEMMYFVIFEEVGVCFYVDCVLLLVWFEVVLLIGLYLSVFIIFFLIGFFCFFIVIYIVFVFSYM